jgi:hypothetical protein
MSVVHGKWSSDEIREVILHLDEKTGMRGATLPIYLCRSIPREGNHRRIIGTYRPSYGKSKYNGCFSFSQAFFDDSEYEDLAVIDCIRHEYCHFLVDALELESVFDDDDPHGTAWKTVCVLLNTSRNGGCYFRSTTESGLRAAVMGEDIPEVNITEQLDRWGLELPSLSRRRYLEKELTKKYSRVRVFHVHDRLIHQKYGKGTVQDTMPSEKKQLLYTEFDNGEFRIVQNRQVYKLVDEKVKKPVPKAG